ncbi:Shedu anti-phage system protein SduA domain-containing protein [Paenisporosarcina macmurdoensis]|uniref:Shedu anti-phage system protein SduA domain-containing protein n=1 Tax=Paenisporosarcina macmurdoensis TaxID=212659 RepID=A0ABW1LAJ8_9BACL
MKLSNRDYLELTDEEIAAWKIVQEKENIKIEGVSFGKRNHFREYPKAVRHYLSLFPNKYLDIEELKDEEKISSSLKHLLGIIHDDTSTERTILNYINDNKAYFIIGSILNYFPFGHHDAYVFPEFQVGNSFKVDYLIIGKNSDGYHFVCVELEHPNKNITIKDGSLGDAFRKGLSQTEDWENWLEKYHGSLRETLEKHLNPSKQLPSEFFTNDKTRWHYVVVAGKRSDFQEKTRKLKRNLLPSRKLLLHYENLIDSSEAVIGKPCY